MSNFYILFQFEVDESLCRIKIIPGGCFVITCGDCFAVEGTVVWVVAVVLVKYFSIKNEQTRTTIIIIKNANADFSLRFELEILP